MQVSSDDSRSEYLPSTDVFLGPENAKKDSPQESNSQIVELGRVLIQRSEVRTREQKRASTGALRCRGVRCELNAPNAADQKSFRPPIRRPISPMVSGHCSGRSTDAR